MASSTEPQVIGDVLKWDQPMHYSREKLTATSGQTLNIGNICETIGGKQVVVATPGNADSICLENLGTISADTEATFLVRDGIYDGAQCDYNSQTEATVDAALKALGMIRYTEAGE